MSHQPDNHEEQQDNLEDGTFMMYERSRGDAEDARPIFRSMPLVSSRFDALTIGGSASSPKAHPPAAQRSNPVVESQKTGSVILPNIPSEWRRSLTLPSMGAFGVLARTRTSFPVADLQLVLARLVSIFQSLSFQTKYSSNFSATCISIDQVELAVNLWDSRNSTGVVEIHRVSGCTILFSQYARKIIHAITAKETPVPQPPPLQSAQSNDPDNIDRCFRMMISHLPESESTSELTESSLEMTTNLLSCDRKDARTLGLQSLVMLTNPSKTLPDIAVNFSKAMLLGTVETSDGRILNDTRIQKHVCHLALLGRWVDTPADDRDAIDLDRPDVQLAMMAVANAVSLIKAPEHCQAFLEVASKYLSGGSLVQLMQHCVWNAACEPHLAYLATRILSALCLAQPNAVRKFVHPEVVRAAQHVGESSHAALEMESGRLLTVLEVSAA